MLKIIHPVAGCVALITIIMFWSSTIFAELFASQATVIAVKTAIPSGFLLLIPALAVTGASGITLAKGRRANLIKVKIKRMPLIVANGVLVLIPSALFLSSKAKMAEFDASFYLVQLFEIIAGATNIWLMSLNMRDGLRMKGRIRHQSN